MRKFSTPVMLAVLLLAGCGKDNELPALNLPEDQGCIERRVVTVNDHLLSTAEVNTINNLFTANSMEKKYRYYTYSHGPLQTQFPPFVVRDNKIVRADQFTKGLRIMTAQLVFNFIDDKLNFTGGSVNSGTSLDNKPRLRLKQIRKLFLDHAEQFDGNASQFKDVCLHAELGYYNINAGSGNMPEILIKAWRVTPKGTLYPSEYPEAFYRDNDGSLISYHNGIQTFK